MSLTKRKIRFFRKKEKRKALCPSGKVPYTTEESANFFADAETASRATKMRAYKCDKCENWHLATVKPPRLKNNRRPTQ